jgi:hypothetical protein
MNSFRSFLLWLIYCYTRAIDLSRIFTKICPDCGIYLTRPGAACIYLRADLKKIIFISSENRGEEGGGGERVSVIHNGCSAPVGCSQRGLKNSLVLFERTFALRQGFKQEPDYRFDLVVDTYGRCRFPTINQGRETALPCPENF